LNIRRLVIKSLLDVGWEDRIIMRMMNVTLEKPVSSGDF
jgi:hypothetical protein